MVPVFGRPFIDWQLTWLRSQGVGQVILCVGYGAERVEAFVGSGRLWGVEVTYSL